MNDTLLWALGWGSVALLAVAILWRLMSTYLLKRFEAGPLVCELVALMGLVAYGQLIATPLVTFAAFALAVGAIAGLTDVAQKHKRAMGFTRRSSDPRVVRLRVLSSVLDDGDRRRIR
jgi:hypothetical protein